MAKRNNVVPLAAVKPVQFGQALQERYLSYALSTIMSRSLPDVRDGLKPVHRRLLYAMRQLRLDPNSAFKKSARVVGDVIGQYHPHGDQSIYDALVRLAQEFAARYPLIEGQGNFGNIDGDNPAAMRYTEARLTHLGAALMLDMDQNTVEFVDNYDETTKEPVVFPAAFPNLLVNGGTGIAVGMATNIPPHNLGEVVDAICAQVDNPQITPEELMQHIKGPDFPTGCVIHGYEGIRSYFKGGRGSMRIRSRAHFETDEKKDRERIVVTEIPYGVNRALLVERIAQLVNEKVLTGITAVRDESDEKTRVVVDLKREAIPDVVLNNLYANTAMETTFAANMLAIDHGRPKLLSVKEALAAYIEHRRIVVLNRTRFQLGQARDRALILEGQLVALGNLDEFIRIIRSSSSRDEAKARILALKFARAEIESYGIKIRDEGWFANPEQRFSLSEGQVDRILDLRLYQLTGLERDKITSEYAEVLARIADLEDILAHEHRVFEIIKIELSEIKAKHATPRLTEIVPDAGEIAIEDLIANKPAIITLTHRGYIKRTEAEAFRAQKRGGKGVMGMATRESSGEADDGDFVEHLFTASTHDYLIFFTRDGRCYVQRVYEVPEGSRNSKGRSLANVLDLRPDEKIAAMIRIPSKGPGREEETWDPNGHLVFATRSGIVKKSNLGDFKNIRKGGLIAIQIEDGDALIDVKLTNGANEIVLVTHDGMSLRFAENELRDQGRDTVGVWGIRPEKGDYVVSMAIVDMASMLLVAGENGIGKRTGFDEYRVQSRGGKGIITMKTGEKTGKVIAALTVHEEDELMLTTSKGQAVRIRVREIREAGRNTMGVKLISLPEGELLADIAPIVREEDEGAEPGPSEPGTSELGSSEPGSSEPGSSKPEAPTA
ncbi:MAG: DNA gyrase subunit A [Verrucomicrobia bacterium]|nr:DNA gyrase subunit A [Verrucomicrobiota bacterium]